MGQIKRATEARAETYSFLCQTLTTRSSRSVSSSGSGADGYVQFSSAAVVGDWIEFDITGVPAGRYQVQFRYKANSGRGTSQLTVNEGEPLGTAVEQSSGVNGQVNNQFYTVIPGETLVTGSVNVFRFVMTAAGTQVFNRIDLIPVGVERYSFLCQDLARRSSRTISNSGSGADGYVQFSSAASADDWAEFDIDGIPAGKYQIQFRYKANSGRGSSRLQVNEGELSETVIDQGTNGNGQAANEFYTVDLGEASLSGDVNTFRFVMITAGTQVFNRIELIRSGVEDENLLLADLRIDGQTVADFDPFTFGYTVPVPVGEDYNDIPAPAVTAEITAEAEAAGVTYTVIQDEYVPGRAIITVVNTEGEKLDYIVSFTAEGLVFLSDLSWTYAASGWSGTEKARRDTNIAGGPLDILDKVYRKGIGTFSESVIRYNLNKQYVRFLSDVGIDYSKFSDNDVVLQYAVFCDGSLRWSSGPIRNNDQGWPTVDISVEGIGELELRVDYVEERNENDFADWGGARLVPGESTGTLLKDLLLDGVSLPGFSRNTLEYAVRLNYGSTEIPVVTAVPENEDAVVTIEQAASVPGEAVVTVSRYDDAGNLLYETVYTVSFTFKDEGLDTVKLTADKDRVNPLLDEGSTARLSTEIYMGDGSMLDEDDPAVTVEYSIIRTNQTGDIPPAVLEGREIVPQKYDSFIDETGFLEDAWIGGVVHVQAAVTVDGVTKTDSKPIYIRPFFLDYSKTMIVKLNIMHRNAYYNQRPTQMFDQALQAVKNLDAVTRGIPKVAYMVGWMYEGSDTGYPGQDYVNQMTRPYGSADPDFPDTMTPAQALIKLIEEAKKYNTAVSLHINMTGATRLSKFWPEYVCKEIIGRRADGGFSTYGGGTSADPYMNWETGMYMRTMKRLFALLPNLVDTRTMHVDALHATIPSSQTGFGSAAPYNPYGQKKYNYSDADVIQSERKFFQFFRTNDMDLTSEFVSSYRPSGETFLGLQPAAWHFRQTSAAWNLEVPADLYAGGDGGALRYGGNNSNVQGGNTYNNGMVGNMGIFAKGILVGQYLSNYERLADDGITVTYSDGITATETLVLQRGKVLRDGTGTSDTNVLIPALWKFDHHKELIAYSDLGYTGRVWELPDEFADIRAVDIYSISRSGLTQTASNVDCSDGTLTLTLGATSAYAIVPAGTEMEEPLIHLETLTLRETELALEAGMVKKLHARISPQNPYDKGIIFTSSDERIARVNPAGVVEALREGQVTITATAKDEAAGILSDTCTITVSGNMEQAANPVGSLPSGTYAQPQYLTLTSDTESIPAWDNDKIFKNVDIYYTLDGTEPNVVTGHYYNNDSTTPAPIPINHDVTVKAIAVRDGLLDSEIVTFEYVIENQRVDAPLAIVPPNHYTGLTESDTCAQRVSLYSLTPGAEVYFTVDGSTPTRASAKSNRLTPIWFAHPMTIKAIAVKEGYEDSEVSVFDYQITYITSRTAIPNVSHPSGVYSEPISVTLDYTRNEDGSSRGGTIYYTLDGTDPASSGTRVLYQEGDVIDISSNTKLWAYNTGDRSNNGNIANASAILKVSYLFTDQTPVCEPPVPSVPPGRYQETQYVSLTTATPGTEFTLIRYEVNGEPANWKSTFVYEGRPVVVDKSMTIRAMTMKEGYIDSVEVDYTYIIDKN